MISYILPLFTAPVVTRAFGPGLFGFIVTATAATSYVSLIMSFGFPWSGPRLVAREKNDPRSLSLDVSAILLAQLGLGIFGSLIFIVWTLTTCEPPDLRLAQWSILVAAVFTTMVPAWLFQGLERMPELVIPQLLVRVAATFCIVLLVKSQRDLLLYVSINAASAFVGVVIFWLLLRRVGLTPCPPALARIWVRIRESSMVFLSNAAISFYTTANVLVVSAVLGNESAGIFGLADRVRVAALGLLMPMTQAIYPFVCRTMGSDDRQEQLARRRTFQIMIWTSAALGVLMYFTAPFAVAVLGGPHFSSAMPLVRIFSIIPLLVTLSNILGVQMMLPRKMDRSVATVVIACAAFGVPLQFIFTRLFGLPGSAWAYAIVEFTVCCGFSGALLLSRER